MSTKNEIAKALARGETKTDIAKSLGITPAVISQHLAQDSFNAMVEELKAKYAIAEEVEDQEDRIELYKAIDDTYDNLEASALQRLSELVDSGLITKPLELLRVTEFANNAKRKNVDNRVNSEFNNTTVNLSVSNILVNAGQKQEVKVDARNQVVAVGDTPIASTSKEGIYKALEELKEMEQKKLDAPARELTVDDF